MKYDPKQEILVLQTIKHLGQATTEEIREYLQSHYDHEIAANLLERIVKRWEKRKVVTSSVVQGSRTFFLRDVPWLGRLQMMQVVGIPDAEAKEFLKGLEKSAKDIAAVGSKGPAYADYTTLRCVFETLDYVAGGDLGKEERTLTFPRNPDGNLYIKPNWMYGFLRDNIRLINESSLPRYIAISPGKFLKQPELVKIQSRVKEGHATYECIRPGNRFEMTLRFPLKGFENLKSVEDIKGFFDLVAEAPIRGLGANPRNFGGRVALVEMGIT